MPAKITQYLNRTVLVSIPALFGEGNCTACTLLGADDQGLWLDSEHMIKRLLGDDNKVYRVVGSGAYVPFAQIAGVLPVTTAAPTPPRKADAQPAAAQTASAKAQTSAKRSKWR
jgi:hypothetical protein